MFASKTSPWYIYYHTTAINKYTVFAINNFRKSLEDIKNSFEGKYYKWWREREREGERENETRREAPEKNAKEYNCLTVIFHQSIRK